jgi:Type III flagellar switch regulator (C-ring) FliN C-term
MLEPAPPAVLQSIILERLLGKAKDEDGGSPSPSKTGMAMLSKLGAAITTGLSSKIGIELTEQKPQQMQTWLKSLGPSVWIIAACQREGDPDPVILALGAAAVSHLTSLAFGAEEPSAAEESSGELTSLEIEFLPVLADMFLPAVLEPTRTPLLKPICCRADKFDASSVSNAAAAVFQFNLSLGAMAWPLRIAALSQSAARPGGAPGPSESDKSTSWKAHLSEEIGRSRLSADAVIDLHPHTLAKLTSLRAGDVLPIPEGNLRNCALKARGEPIYWGKLGRQGGIYSFRVSAPARAGGGLVDSIVKGIDRNTTKDRSGTT